MDTKKKEPLGNKKNVGKEYCPKGSPREVDTHDFPDAKRGKAIPYGVYDISKNEAWVSIGINHDTAEFAVASIERWWNEMGKLSYPDATELTITADAGGSNSYRTHGWKVHLQKMADKLRLQIHVRHFPPGTSKWNKIEHRMFCHISQNWRARPLIDLTTVVSLIGGTKTKTGLTIKVALDQHEYATGIKITKEQLDAVNLQPAPVRGEWNYTISPEPLCGIAYVI